MRLLLAILLTVPPLTACTQPDTTTVALLLADRSGGSTLIDVEAFTDRVELTCKECEVEVYDAGGDAAEQKSQARQAVAAESDVLAIWPVDPDEAEGIGTDDTPVVSLVTLVPGSDRFVGMAEGEPDVPEQGSDLGAARAIVLGQLEGMTFVPVRAMSEQAADVVVAQVAGTRVPDGEEHEGVTSWLFETTEVTLDTLTTVLVGQGAIDLEELCEGSTARRCQRFGLR